MAESRRATVGAALLVCAVVGGGCAVGAPPAAPAGAPASRSLAVPAEPLTTVPEPTSGVGPAPAGAGPAAASPTSEGTSSRSPGAAVSTAGFRPLVRLSDRTGDAGVAAPAYADIVAVTVESDATSVRLIVRVAGPLPQRVASSDVMGIGVDLYRADTTESDYQAFADGEPDGWFAYLDTPGGFVRYPGTLAIGGDEAVFTLPWSAVGKLVTGRVSAFADWSRTVAPASALDSSDRAPDTGSTSWSR